MFPERAEELSECLRLRVINLESPTLLTKFPSANSSSNSRTLARSGPPSSLREHNSLEAEGLHATSDASVTLVSATIKAIGEAVISYERVVRLWLGEVRRERQG